MWMCLMILIMLVHIFFSVLLWLLKLNEGQGEETKRYVIKFYGKK